MDNDPFGIEKAIKIPGFTDKTRRAVHGGVQAAKKTVGPKASNAYHNVASKPADRHPGGPTMGRYGKLKNEQVSDLKYGAAPSAIAGAGVGTLAGVGYNETLGGSREVRANNKKIKANNSTIRANSKVITAQNRAAKKTNLSKARTRLITDVGTKSGRFANKRWPAMNKKYVAASAAASGGAVVLDNKLTREHAQKPTLHRQNATITRQQSRISDYGTVRKMSTSAFGVDHGEIFKADKKPTPASLGRIVTGAVLSPVHGAVAGKRGHKLRAAGNEYGGYLGGKVGAELAASKLGVNPVKAGRVVGAVGAGVGTLRAQRKGHYKDEIK